MDLTMRTISIVRPVLLTFQKVLTMKRRLRAIRGRPWHDKKAHIAFGSLIGRSSDRCRSDAVEICPAEWKRLSRGEDSDSSACGKEAPQFSTRQHSSTRQFLLCAAP